MAKVKLGSKKFDVDCKEIWAGSCGVSDAECVELGARMKGGEFQRVKTVFLVSFFPHFFIFFIFFGVVKCEGCFFLFWALNLCRTATK